MSNILSQSDTEKLVAEIVKASVERIVPRLSAQLGILKYHCTGSSFGCDDMYICDNANHSCKTDSSFSCGGHFSCTGGAFGVVLGIKGQV